MEQKGQSHVDCLFSFLQKSVYSVLNVVAGFIRAALNVSVLTVSKAITTADPPADK